MLVPLAEDESPPVPAPTVPEAVPEPPPPAPLRAAATTDRKRVGQLEQELEAAAQERDALALQLDELRGIVAAADAQRAEIEANLRRERRSADAAGETRDEVQRARAAAERARDAALAQRDEAVQDREAAVRTRTRMELAHADAVEAQAAAEAALARAHDERDEAQSQRDEALLAYRALRHHVHSERAGIDRAEHDGDEHAAGADPDEPLGVRTMPAARTIMAELQRPKPSSKFVVSPFDVWVVRVLGSVAAVCFILLLVSIMRVFI
jgi:DNA repair exonuclease SbcCD ATPase subunit